MNILSGPMFEPSKGELFESSFRKEGAHYNIFHSPTARGMDAIRCIFPDGEANEFNLALFSTSGVHGTYTTIEEVEDWIIQQKTDWGKSEGEEQYGPEDVTFLIIHPRIVCLRYGLCQPKTQEDFNFLKKLRASSYIEFSKIGVPNQDSTSPPHSNYNHAKI